MKIIRIDCDNCGDDITNSDSHTLELKNIPPRNSNAIRTLVKRYPILDSDYHFCCMNCLGDWIRNRK